MNRRILILTMICILTVLAGCGKKAEPIDLPSNEAVISIEVITFDGAKADITEANQIETVMTALSAAEPTRLESVNASLRMLTPTEPSASIPLVNQQWFTTTIKIVNTISNNRTGESMRWKII